MDFGVSYYPELIPENEWGRDLDRIALSWRNRRRLSTILAGWGGA